MYNEKTREPAKDFKAFPPSPSEADAGLDQWRAFGKKNMTGEHNNVYERHDYSAEKGPMGLLYSAMQPLSFLDPLISKINTLDPVVKQTLAQFTPCKSRSSFDLHPEIWHVILKHLDWESVKTAMLIDKNLYNIMRGNVGYIFPAKGHPITSRVTFSDEAKERNGLPRLTEWNLFPNFVKPVIAARCALEDLKPGTEPTSGFRAITEATKPISMIVFDSKVQATQNIEFSVQDFTLTWLSILQHPGIFVLEIHNSFFIDTAILQYTRLKGLDRLQVLRLRGCPLLNRERVGFLRGAPDVLCDLKIGRDVTFDIDSDIIGACEHNDFEYLGYPITQLSTLQKLLPKLLRMKSRIGVDADVSSLWDLSWDVLVDDRSKHNCPTSLHPITRELDRLTGFGKQGRNYQNLPNPSGKVSLEPAYLSQYQGSAAWSQQENEIATLAKKIIADLNGYQSNVSRSQMIKDYADRCLARQPVVLKRAHALLEMNKLHESLLEKGNKKMAARILTTMAAFLKIPGYTQGMHGERFSRLMAVHLNPENEKEWPSPENIIDFAPVPNHGKEGRHQPAAPAMDPFLQCFKDLFIAPDGHLDLGRKELRLIKCKRCNHSLYGIGFSATTTRHGDNICRDCREKDLLEQMIIDNQYYGQMMRTVWESGSALMTTLVNCSTPVEESLLLPVDADSLISPQEVADGDDGDDSDMDSYAGEFQASNFQPTLLYAKPHEAAIPIQNFVAELGKLLKLPPPMCTPPPGPEGCRTLLDIALDVDRETAKEAVIDALKKAHRRLPETF